MSNLGIEYSLCYITIYTTIALVLRVDKMIITSILVLKVHIEIKLN